MYGDMRLRALAGTPGVRVGVIGAKVKIQGYSEDDIGTCAFGGIIVSPGGSKRAVIIQTHNDCDVSLVKVEKVRYFFCALRFNIEWITHQKLTVNPPEC